MPANVVQPMDAHVIRSLLMSRTNPQELADRLLAHARPARMTGPPTISVLSSRLPS
jgi:hypothetical protein